MPTKKILAVGPHPDDIEFSVGGILVKEIKNGNKVEMFVMSQGEASTNGTPVQRRDEATDAAKIIGATILFGDFGGDSHIVYSIENVMTMAREIRRFRPNVILVNSPDANQHPDHVQASQIVSAAARLARYGGVEELKDLKPHAIDVLYFYPATLNVGRLPDIIIDITDHSTQWQKAMSAHKSQLKTRKYVDLVVARARVLGLSINADYAQGLYHSDPVVLNLPTDITDSTRNF